MISIRCSFSGVTTIFFSCRAALSDPELYSIRRFRDVSQSELVVAALLLDWRSIYFVSGTNVKVDLFYSMLFFLLMDTFAPKPLVRVSGRGTICVVFVIGWMTVLSLRSVEQQSEQGQR
jgi:hypothetical protein